MDWNLINLDADSATPLYLQLCSSLTEAIKTGKLEPGDQLPSERKLAGLLAISRTTAVNAYEELEARGLVRSYVGRGTFISARPDRLGAQFAWRGKVSPLIQRHLGPDIRALLASNKPQMISFSAGQPAYEYFPVERFLAVTESRLRSQPRDTLGFLPAEGHPYLRECIATREGVRHEEVMIVAGTQQALDLIARCLIYPQDRVVMDWPGYLGAIQSFQFSGAVLSGWDMTLADLDELEDSLIKHRPKLLYLNPSFQNPTACTLSLETRQGIIDLARKYRTPIVEDEAYRDLYFATEPPPSLFELEGSGLVLYIRSLSKTFAPGLRLGYIVADEAIIDQLALVKAQGDLFTPGLSQLALADLLTNGVYDNYLKLLRLKHQERARVMEASLQEAFPEGLSWQKSQGGLYIWAQLHHLESGELLAEATKAGVSFMPGSSFFFEPGGKRALRLWYSGTEPEAIRSGVERLKRAYNQALGMSGFSL